ncbi:hypothetical protein B9Z19DRAFT_1120418 [Tuber borchii]|uniref:Uncharacterized protein n=1 Tax=Tuber borchii TaxID=42251 RepID=A0A2T7A4L5_TUBBO|nr:hypothetical protein B9Z19DRAFT_1120418 [Tuber borchii]
MVSNVSSKPGMGTQAGYCLKSNWRSPNLLLCRIFSWIIPSTRLIWEQFNSSERSDLQATCKTASNTTSNATTQLTLEGNLSGKLNPDSIFRMSSSVITHGAFIAEVASRPADIKLGSGPGQSFETIFRTVVQGEHSRYTAANETVYNRGADNVDNLYGMWTSHSLVINASRDNQKALEDVGHG